VLKVEVLSLTDTDSGKRWVIIRRDKFSESKVGGASGMVKNCDC